MSSIMDTPICLSGGADGADSQWGMCAGMAGHQVIHFSFAGHRITVPKEEIVVLTSTQLSEADPHLEQANVTLERRVPYDKPWIVNLLRRNWYQVKDAEVVYAVSHLDKDGKVDGGTAWAVQMFINRFDGMPCPVYLYDQQRGEWLTWMGGWWAVCSFVPTPDGIYAGIGSRKLLDSGKRAIRALLNYAA